MISTSPIIDTICNNFPNTTRMHISRELILKFIITNHHIQCKNAASLNFFEEQDVLAAIITPAQYHAFTRASFLPPVDPGHTFMTPLTGATPQHRSIKLEDFKAKKYCYMYWVNSLITLTKQ